MLFLEGNSALFKTALCLLGFHKEKLLQESGFENIMAYLKTNLPQMEDKQVHQVVNEVSSVRLRICSNISLTYDKPTTTKRNCTSILFNYPSAVFGYQYCFMTKEHEILGKIKLVHKIIRSQPKSTKSLRI